MTSPASSYTICAGQGMLEDFAHHKADEQYPLLMVAGAGDASVRTPPPTSDPQIWTTTITPRRPWSDRWPEYLSTCWMTIILLGISFLVFYAVGMVVIYRHEGYILVKCNDTKPASEVFYHHVVSRGEEVQLLNYEAYLANVASLYPSLRFYIYFLIDDTIPAKSNILEKIYPNNFFAEYNAFNRREVRVFQRRFPNINISVVSLSKFMAGTPLKYRWKSIPIKYIPFYCRVFSVWLNGGMGLDLVKHNEQYYMDNPQRIDRKARALMRQHNEGISPEKYMKTLFRLESEDESEYFASFVCIMQKMFNDTISYFTSTPSLDSSEKPMNPPFPPLTDAKPLVRTHRTKREVVEAKQENETTKGNNTSDTDVVNIVLDNSKVMNVTVESSKKNVYQILAQDSNEKPDVTKKSAIPELVLTDSGWHYLNFPNYGNSKLGSSESFKSPESVHEAEKNKSEGSQIVLFYDFSLETAPMRSDVYLINPKEYRSPLKVVAIGAEGSFVASTGRLHPFLGAILSGGCKRLPPKYAIQNALLAHCTGSYKDEICNSIHVL